MDYKGLNDGPTVNDNSNAAVATKSKQAIFEVADII